MTQRTRLVLSRRSIPVIAVGFNQDEDGQPVQK